MNCKKMIVLILAQGLMLTNCTVMHVSATEMDFPTAPAAGDENIDSTGLIINYGLSISAGTKTVYITASTYGSDTMAKIGFKDIEVQYSANGYSGWTTELNLGNDYDTDTDYYQIYNEPHSVTGGYYYRVVLDHYAKETGFWFPGTESIPNTSNVVWVP